MLQICMKRSLSCVRVACSFGEVPELSQLEGQIGEWCCCRVALTKYATLETVHSSAVSSLTASTTRTAAYPPVRHHRDKVPPSEYQTGATIVLLLCTAPGTNIATRCPTLALSTITAKSVAVRTAFYHPALFSPALSPWCKVIDAVFFRMWPQLKSGQVINNTPQSLSIQQCHLD